MLDLCDKYRQQKEQIGVVAFDVAGDEGSYPLQLHEEALKKANELNINLVPHCGKIFFYFIFNFYLFI